MLEDSNLPSHLACLPLSKLEANYRGQMRKCDLATDISQNNGKSSNSTSVDYLFIAHDSRQLPSLIRQLMHAFGSTRQQATYGIASRLSVSTQAKICRPDSA